MNISLRDASRRDDGIRVHIPNWFLATHVLIVLAVIGWGISVEVRLTSNGERAQSNKSQLDRIESQLYELNRWARDVRARRVSTE